MFSYTVTESAKYFGEKFFLKTTYSATELLLLCGYCAGKYAEYQQKNYTATTSWMQIVEKFSNGDSSQYYEFSYKDNGPNYCPQSVCTYTQQEGENTLTLNYTIGGYHRCNKYFSYTSLYYSSDGKQTSYADTIDYTIEFAGNDVKCGVKSSSTVWDIPIEKEFKYTTTTNIKTKNFKTISTTNDIFYDDDSYSIFGNILTATTYLTNEATSISLSPQSYQITVNDTYEDNAPVISTTITKITETTAYSYDGGYATEALTYNYHNTIYHFNKNDVILSLIKGQKDKVYSITDLYVFYQAKQDNALTFTFKEPEFKEHNIGTYDCEKKDTRKENSKAVEKTTKIIYGLTKQEQKTCPTFSFEKSSIFNPHFPATTTTINFYSLTTYQSELTSKKTEYENATFYTETNIYIESELFQIKAGSLTWNSFKKSIKEGNFEKTFWTSTFSKNPCTSKDKTSGETAKGSYIPQNGFHLLPMPATNINFNLYYNFGQVALNNLNKIYQRVAFSETSKKTTYYGIGGYLISLCPNVFVPPVRNFLTEKMITDFNKSIYSTFEYGYNINKLRVKYPVLTKISNKETTITTIVEHSWSVQDEIGKDKTNIFSHQISDFMYTNAFSPKKLAFNFFKNFENNYNTDNIDIYNFYNYGKYCDNLYTTNLITRYLTPGSYLKINLETHEIVNFNTPVSVNETVEDRPAYIPFHHTVKYGQYKQGDIGTQFLEFYDNFPNFKKLEQIPISNFINIHQSVQKALDIINK